MPERVGLRLVPRALQYARLNRYEIAGALGDMGAFLPLLIAMSMQNGLDFAVALFFAGFFNQRGQVWTLDSLCESWRSCRTYGEARLSSHHKESSKF